MFDFLVLNPRIALFLVCCKLTRDMKMKRERKKNIFATVSNVPQIQFQARLAVAGAAKNKKKTGLSVVGKLFPPGRR